MKIAILGFAKVKYMPYLHFYLNQFNVKEHELHLIYWQRDQHPDTPLPEGVSGHAYKKAMSDEMPLRKKLPGILGYGRFAKKVIRQLKPDFLVVMHSTTAITVYPQLMGKYKSRYIFDYRDVTYEGNKLYRNAVANIVNHSALSFTSSDGFRKYLPDTPKLLTSHNLLGSLLEKQQRQIKPSHTPIRVSFWGLLRHQKVNHALIERLGGDSRFELHYYGRAQGAMLKMVQEAAEKYNNVFFHGEYTAEDRPAMAAATDLVHNIYGDADRTAAIAMGNKYYDALIFAIPQLCTPDSLMGRLCREKGIGLACDPEKEDFADKLYEYYVNLNGEQFSADCTRELERIVREVEAGNQKIQEVLNGI